MSDSEPKSPYYPYSDQSIIHYLLTELFKSLEREDYLYKRLKEEGILNDEDLNYLSKAADYERLPPMTSEIRDKALDALNRITEARLERKRNASES